MPVKRTKSGGYQYGSSGKVYYGQGAKAKAARQGRAIEANRKRKKRNEPIVKCDGKVYIVR